MSRSSEILKYPNSSENRPDMSDMTNNSAQINFPIPDTLTSTYFPRPGSKLKCIDRTKNKEYYSIVRPTFYSDVDFLQSRQISDLVCWKIQGEFKKKIHT